jgi:hypothetical protein
VKRLVYAPKVWIFVRSTNMGGKIYDVSSDVVRGTVTQNVGELSKARFELRNRFYKWLRSREDKNRTIFLPMDLCTIWMQRVSGRPVQVFTGYLDSVPYYQAYPGNAIFEASCTLKKLAYNWFDPGLPVFYNWLRENGWVFDPTTGEAIMQSRTAATRAGQNETTGAPVFPTTASSASFADLLGRFLVDVAGWSPNDVVITNLPPGLPERALKLYAEFQDESLANLQEASQFMGAILGASGAVGVDNSITAAENKGAPGKASDAHDRASLPQSLPVVKKVSAAASKAGIEPWVLVMAGILATNFNPAYRNTDKSDKSYGYGIYAMRPDPVFRGPPTVEGVGVNSLNDPGIATEVMAKRLNRKKDSPAAKKAMKGDAQAAAAWIQDALGYEFSPGSPSRNVNKIQETYTKALQATGTEKTSSGGLAPTIAIDPKNVPLTDKQVTDRLSAPEQRIVKQNYKDSAPELGAAVLVAKSVAPNVSLRHQGQPTTKNQFFIQGPEEDLDRLFAYYKGKPEYARVQYTKGGEQQVVLQKGAASKTPAKKPKGDKARKLQGILVTVDPAAFDALGIMTISFSDEGIGDAEATGAVEGGLTFKQLAAFSAASSFAAQFSFPTDFLASRFLTGDKALMNDVSCMEGVKQFCAASLRTFRSLPDGRFLAFYPDYFGTFREPYWNIRNIEIVDFGIQLNDEALATHVYVTGDSFYGAGDDLLNRIKSRGVATITQALLLDSFIEPLNMEPSHQLSDLGVPPEDAEAYFKMMEPFTFMEHYGMRPHKEDQPLIRNPLFEFMLAWQRFMWLWSQQFATSVSFTFQPEVMAGGLIGFPDHDVQMYCESVTHTFDYASGFQTTAVLTAPSLMKGKRHSSISKPGFALGGAVNTVGVTS